MTPLTDPAPLKPDAAFVVQVREDCEPREGCLQGRVEHVTSGRALSFCSIEELAAFIRLTLRVRSRWTDVDEPQERDPGPARAQS